MSVRRVGLENPRGEAAPDIIGLSSGLFSQSYPEIKKSASALFVCVI